MPTLNEKKSSVLYVHEILKNYSDELHKLTYRDISEKLEMLYGIEIERKTVARDVDILIDKGVDIVKNGKNGLYLSGRSFERGELLFLLDAIYSSKDLPEKYAKSLATKLTKDCSVFEKTLYKNMKKSVHSKLVENKQVFYTIEVLNEAIEGKKQVVFYHDILHQNDTTYLPVETISPCFLVNQRGEYFLVGYCEDASDLKSYQISDILNVKLTDKDAVNLSKMPHMSNFSVEQYMNEHIYMMSGPSVDAVLCIADDGFVEVLKEWFGENVDVFVKDNKLTAHVRVNENALISWILQHGPEVKVVEPQSTKLKITQILQQTIKYYRQD